MKLDYPEQNQFLIAKAISRRFFYCLLALASNTLGFIQAKADVLYVSTEEGQVMKVTSSGAVTALDTGLKSIHCEAIDSHGDLFVASFDSSISGTIIKITRSGAVSTFATIPDDDDLMDRLIWDMAVDNNDNLFICAGGAILKITTAGEISTFQRDVGITNGLAFDSHGVLYFGEGLGAMGPDLKVGTIYKITSTGKVNEFATGFNDIQDLAFNSKGNLFVSNYDNNTISEVTTTGVASTFVRGLSHPVRLAFDSHDNLFVSKAAVADDGIIYKVTNAGIVNTFTISGQKHISGLVFDHAVAESTVNQLTSARNAFIVFALLILASGSVWLIRKTQRR